MTHATELDLGPLTWVKGEIDQALARAAESLANAAGSSDELSRIQFAQTHLHQACGALSIVGLDGLTQFAQSLDMLLGALARGERKADATTMDIAHRALAAIGNYLEELVRGTVDQPMRLQPLYLEIAQARGASQASGIDLFFPDLGQRPLRRDRGRARMSGSESAEHYRNLRARFEHGLLQWIRNPGDKRAAQTMRDAAEGLELHQAATAAAPLWTVACAFFDTLVGADLAADQQIIKACALLHKELRQDPAAARPAPDRLLRTLLYWVAQAPARTDCQKLVRDTWNLDALVPEPGSVVTETPLAPLLKSLHAELGTIKRNWDEFCAGQLPALGRIEAGLRTLSGSAGQLKRPTFDLLIDGMHGFIDWLQKTPSSFKDAIALEFATALLLAEVSLDRGVPETGFAAQVNDTLNRLGALERGETVEPAEDSPTVETARRLQEREARAQVCREMLWNLAQIEQTLDDFFRNQDKRAPLATLEKPLKQVEGALAMMEDDRAIELIQNAAQTIARLSKTDAEPAPGEFEHLAQRLSALGMYIQGMQHGQSGLEHLLDPESAHRLDTSRKVPAQKMAPIEEGGEPADEQSAPPTEAAPEIAGAVAEEPCPVSIEVTNWVDTLVDEDEAMGLEIVAPPGDETKTRPAPHSPSTPETLSAGGIDAGDLDAELLAIFIEEAHEVLDTIAEQQTGLRAGSDDRDPLVAIRRGFHTLKGSGRMVGLVELGEASWGMEQTLNRWLQLEWPPTKDLLALIGWAHQAFSEWVARIEGGQGHSLDVSDLLSEAERLRQIESPDAVSSAAPASSMTEDERPAGGEHPAMAGEAAAAPEIEALQEAEHTAEAEAPSIQQEPSEELLTFDFGPDELVESGSATEEGSPIDQAPIEEISLDETLLEPMPDFAADQTLVAGLTSPDFTGIGPAEGEAQQAEPSWDQATTLYALDEAVSVDDSQEPGPAADEIHFEEVSLPEEFGSQVVEEQTPPVVSEPAQASASEEIENVPPTPDTEASTVRDDFAHLPLIDLETTEEGVESQADAAREPEPLDLDLMLGPDAGEPQGLEEPVIEIPTELLDTESDLERSGGDEQEGWSDLSEPLIADLEEEPTTAEPEPAEAPEEHAVEQESALSEALPQTTTPEPAFVRLGDTEISRPLFELYLSEADGHLATLHREFAQLRRNPLNAPSEPALRASHTLAGISGTARATPVHQLARALEHAIERLQEVNQPPEPDQTDVLCATADMLGQMLQEVAQCELPLPAPDLEQQLAAIGRQTPEAPAEALTEPEEEPAAIRQEGPGAEAEASRAEAPAAPTVHDDLDEQLLPIFIEEGNELLSQLHATLRAWQEDRDNPEPAKPLARLLHTLKGSARMAGAMRLGEHVHQLESRLETAMHAGQPPASLIEELVAGLDQAEQMMRVLSGVEQAVETAPDEVQVAATTAVAIEAGAPQPESVTGLATLRVRADAVDRFVNEAGEIGIARTRIEGELRTLRRSMLDLTENVVRLRNQLREIEIQAEVQMQSRIAQAESQHAEFDPLEMDRYTRLQELTRMMAESVGDVTTVQQSLLRNLDGAELALHSQARLSRDLQQALMQVRMVPFDSLADRLHRIIRQSAKELGKRANLDIRGGRIEVDRSVLERMTAALEHLLRNAVAHGVETPEARRKAGKDEFGQITLTVSHEGNEIVISLADDGVGLDYEAIAARARERGLLGPDEEADERRLTNLIFVPGFSTASSVSAVSGRGVGMDVVKEEAASVGGRIDVHATPGKGAEFRVYLPLTLAVTQALLVRAGGHSYAIPSNLISQVMELKADALDKVRTDGTVEWQGRQYTYRYLPHLLGHPEAQPEIQRFNWLLLLRTGSQTLALHVDGLRGNQEIVVKNAGPQLVRIVGISGATLLGDGEILLILNPVALASREILPVEHPAETFEPEIIERHAEAHQPTILVVDDSLTVRKITSRLLEREGYRVLTAKDGSDALEKLLDVVPDVILSDIEMPRMDGFDLVRNIRSDPRTQAIPVIMITSRLAEKHRQYAEKVGANHYLGKPFEEEELLGLLHGYTGKVVDRRSAPR